MEQGKFRRKLSLLDLTLLGVGSMVGSGWLFASQTAATMAGSIAWIPWLFGAFAVMLIGLVYGEMAAAIPRAGGFVRYPDYTHGSLVGYLIGFASMMAYSSVAGVEAEAVRSYASSYIPGLEIIKGTATNVTFVGDLFQIALLVLFFLINYWSVRVFGKINTIVTALKFIVPLLTILVLLFHFHPSNFAVTTASPGGIHGAMQALTTGGLVFSFLGFRQAVDFGAEARNPQRDIPRAIVFAVLLSTLIYVMLQLVFIGAVPHNLIANGWQGVTFKSPFANLLETLGLGWMAVIIFADAILSPSGTGNIYLAGTARTLFAWARNGYFYSVIGKIDKRTGLPRGALWLTLILSIVWTLPFRFSMWSGLVNAVTSATVMTYMIGPVGVAALRRYAPELHRPYKLKGLHILAPAAFVCATWIIYWAGWQTDSLLIGFTLASLILYFAFMDKDAASRQRMKNEWKSGIWLIVYYLFVGVMSVLGSFTNTAVYHIVIANPWDTIIVGVGALVFYYWGVASALRVPRIVDEAEAEEVSDAGYAASNGGSIQA
ncbi:APC family permease [Alicyclobacillus fastidiosus]|uniref:APC family permease n=1 Tax=Alicyclobacillus fastidiosus TaxID=392011 RepID=A0ABY6ZD45_9BACL|nr:APC family permease [Alicyclobacillus fastidiosus]WAH40819.1 APC family permease [Alicyclobacillus fastidiosus]GMA62299.1 aspartate:proton symporter [Alicyclobacillus fastidiosus]